MGIAMLVGMLAALLGGLIVLIWSGGTLWQPMGESEQAVAFEIVLQS